MVYSPQAIFVLSELKKGMKGHFICQWLTTTAATHDAVLIWDNAV